jgi:DNA-binding transcriptional LysR family regulator
LGQVVLSGQLHALGVEQFKEAGFAFLVAHADYPGDALALCALLDHVIDAHALPDETGVALSMCPDAHMLINDGESVIQLVVAGLGITQVPRMLAACMLEKGLLELVMTETKSTGKPVWIVYPQKKHLSARVQAFIEWVRELFERTNEVPEHFRRPPVIEAAIEESAGA